MLCVASSLRVLIYQKPIKKRWHHKKESTQCFGPSAIDAAAKNILQKKDKKVHGLRVSPVGPAASALLTSEFARLPGNLCSCRKGI